jgi:hypothetical protein
MMNTMNTFVDGIYKNCIIKCTICVQKLFLHKCNNDDLNYIRATLVKEEKLLTGIIMPILLLP